MAHVLVTDDSATFRRLICPQLGAAGHSVSEASDGEQALEILRASAESFVVVLDVVMPRLGGIGVLNEVDASPALAEKHAFILVTASPEAVMPQVIAEMLERLGVPLLVKPFDMQQLFELVELATERLASTEVI